MAVAGARGRAGEALAAAFLALRGFCLVERNLRLAEGAVVRHYRNAVLDSGRIGP